MSRIDELRQRRANTLGPVTAMARAASDDNRDLTEGEQRSFNDAMAEIDQIDAHIAEIRGQQDRVRQADDAFRQFAGGHAGSGTAGRRLPLPCDLTGEQLRAMHDAVRSGQPYRAETRAVSGLGWEFVPGQFAGANYTDGPRVANLFGVESTEAPSVRVYVASSPATAGVVTEGSAKPAAGLTLTPVDVAMTKIATWERVSMEMILDFPSFQSQVGRELTRAVISEENEALTATLLAAALTAQTSAGDDGIDASATAIASLQAAGVRPTAVIVSPGRLAAIRSVKADSAGVYAIDPTQGGPATLHGLPVTVTPELSDDVLLVGDFDGAGTVYVRDQVSVRAGLDGSDFSENMVSLVAEERLALAVTVPSRIVNVDLAAA